MSNDMCVRRLTKELRAMKKDPVQNPKITVAPNEANILEMHYVIEGSKGTPYEGGVYHGKLLFPKEYPLKPPGVMMLTPSGRFQPNRRLCLSMSDFHPESWNPMWSVSTILTGLYSFMIETNPTLGSIETSHRKKRQYAMQSLEYNVKNDKMFCKLFPEYVDRYERELRERAAAAASAAEHHNANSSNGVGHHNNTAAVMQQVAIRQAVEGMEMPLPLAATLAGLVAILSIVVMFCRFL